MENKDKLIIRDIESYTQIKRSIRNVVSYIKCLFDLNDMSEFFNWEHIKVINQTGEVNICFPNGKMCIIKCKMTKLSMLYRSLLDYGVDIDSFDNVKDSIKDLDKFIEKYETGWGTQCALYHFSGESVGFFINDYVNTTTLQSEDICWELQEDLR